MPSPAVVHEWVFTWRFLFLLCCFEIYVWEDDEEEKSSVVSRHLSPALLLRNEKMGFFAADLQLGFTGCRLILLHTGPFSPFLLRYHHRDYESEMKKKRIFGAGEQKHPESNTNSHKNQINKNNLCLESRSEFLNTENSLLVFFVGAPRG